MGILKNLDYLLKIVNTLGILKVNNLTSVTKDDLISIKENCCEQVEIKKFCSEEKIVIRKKG